VTMTGIHHMANIEGKCKVYRVNNGIQFIRD
jgi:hypothetical protein